MTDKPNESLPTGWDAEKIRRVLEHYENQTEDEAALEDEAAHEDGSQTLMEVPTELVPQVRALIAQRRVG